MKKCYKICVLSALILSALSLVPVAVAAAPADIQLTIYNEDFATIKESRRFEVQRGTNTLHVPGISRLLEPDTVIARDISERSANFRVLEQSHSTDALTQDRLLRAMEGRYVRFQTDKGNVISAKVVRAKTTIQIPNQWGGTDSQTLEPIIDVHGDVQFELPGKPLFDKRDHVPFQEASLDWKTYSDRTGKCDVEFSYITRGLSWDSCYNLVMSSAAENVFTLSGWVNIQNKTGKAFQDASVKLLAGDVAKVKKAVAGVRFALAAADSVAVGPMEAAPDTTVRARAFDEFYVYDLPNPVTMSGDDYRQVSIFQHTNVIGRRVYTFDGAQTSYSVRPNDRGLDVRPFMWDSAKNTKVNAKVVIPNIATNGMGMPLPKGIIRMYRTDAWDGRNEFIGETSIDHTPAGATLELDIGNVMDLKGERKQLSFQYDESTSVITETIEIAVTNAKPVTVDVYVVEHLPRGANWEISAKRSTYEELDATTVRFLLRVPSKREMRFNYTVTYTPDPSEKTDKTEEPKKPLKPLSLQPVEAKPTIPEYIHRATAEALNALIPLKPAAPADTP